MKLGQRLLELRKSKHLSQEEVAYKLNVTRQTISKWETDQSTPDFDKIIPLCELYGISSDELLTGKKENLIMNNEEEFKRNKRAKAISIGVLLYFSAIAWIMVTIPVFRMNPIVSSAIFLLICGVATYIIVYNCIVYKKKISKEEEQKNKLVSQINNIIALITVVIYLVISFSTMAWHITWIIWIVYGIIEQIVKLIFMLRGNENEK